MNRYCRKSLKSGGALMEVVLSIGVLGAVIPVVLGAMTQSALSNAHSKSETRCAWMVPTCVDEWNAQRLADPDLNELFLVFSSTGLFLGDVDADRYGFGVASLGASDAMYMVRVVGNEMGPRTVLIDYPATLPKERRSSVAYQIQ